MSASDAPTYLSTRVPPSGLIAGATGLRGQDGQPGPPGAPGPTGSQGPAGLVQSVNGKSSASITLTASDVGALASTGGTVTGGVNFLAVPTVAGNPLVDRSRLWYNAKDLGCVGNGIADDTAAFGAIPGLVPSGSTVYFPPGVYLITNGLAYSDKSITWIGGGIGQTIIRFRPSSSGNAIFNVTLNDILYKFGCRGFTFSSNMVAGGVGIALSKPNAASNIFDGPRIEGNEFIGEDPNNNGFNICISLTHAYHFRVNGNVATGPGGASSNPFSGTFLQLSGHSTDGTVFDNRVASMYYGVHILNGSFAEGMQITNNKFVGIQYGLYLEDGLAAPGMQIAYNHVNSHSMCIRLIGRPQVQIHGNLLYKFASGYNWVGVQFEKGSNSGSDLCSVKGNQILGFSNSYTGTSSGIVGATSSWVMVVENQIQACSVGLDLTNSAFGVDNCNLYVQCATPRQGVSASGHNAGTAYTY